MKSLKTTALSRSLILFYMENVYFYIMCICRSVYLNKSIKTFIKETVQNKLLNADIFITLVILQFSLHSLFRLLQRKDTIVR